MANKMLIDATHPEETRVVVLRGNRVEEFDFEAANRKQLRGNIYLAKVTRVEPSLQAAFVDYGGNRHGFLAFSEIHPDYYQIPVADRKALLEEERLRRRPDDDFEPADGEDEDEGGGVQEIDDVEDSDVEEVSEGAAPGNGGRARKDAGTDDGEETPDAEDGPDRALSASGDDDAVISGELPAAPSRRDDEAAADAGEEASEDAGERAGDDAAEASADGEAAPASAEGEAGGDAVEASEAGEQADGAGEAEQREAKPRAPRRKRSRAKKSDDEQSDQEAPSARPRRRYKIQEVIKRRQIILVQVVKEERGNKGAALTTYLSLAGRYSVLMPNSARGGGISRKITQPGDRKRLKQIANELPVPEGMGVILRTAGMSRTKTEIKRDFEYLMRLWETVRDLTLKSTAPTLVYEEGNLVKRSIRDLYNKDIDEVLVAGETGYREAKDFMRMLMPSHAKNVQPYRDKVPIFAKNRVEPQLDAMFLPQVTLPSGGYVVINQTEALVAIDVNSGKATREHNIEDTALRTNVEAAEEIARQLRLRDLAGLIVVDFIDMEENRNNRTVERKLKDCLKTDRARIQVGRISHFGLLEMSRQRLRTGVLESSTELCPHCHGTGVIRSTESVALHVLRSIEDQLLRNASHNLAVRIRTEVALYIINHKRHSLSDIEQRYGISINLQADETIEEAYCIIERNGLAEPQVKPTTHISADTFQSEMVDDDDEDEDAEAGAVAEQPDEDEGEPRKRRRKRRRRGRDGEDGARAATAGADDDGAGEEEEEGEPERAAADGDDDAENREDGNGKKRRRGRRGGRRNKRTRPQDGEGGETEAVSAEPDAAEPDRAPESGSGFDQVEPVAEAADRADPGPDAAEPAEQAGQPQPEEMAEAGADRVSAEPETGVAEDDVDSGDSEAAAEPAPPAEEPARAEQSPQPKRSGWWQKRGFFAPS